MNWEEYQNSDWYREAHPEVFEKTSRADLLYQEMCSCVSDIKCYYDELEAKDDEDEEKGLIVCYVVTKLWNCRVRGILSSGGYVDCRMAMYEYNAACIDSEWDSAGIERIVAEDKDELEEILNGYRDCDWCDDYYDDYEY